MFGEFVTVEDDAQPWAPWKIWVEYHWLDYKTPTLESAAREIIKSNWPQRNKLMA